MRKRVAVTGLGIISPVGIGKETVWKNLLAGKSGIKRITAFDTTDFAVRIAGEVEGFTATDYMDRKEARHMDRFAHFGVAAAKMAVEDAKIDWNALDHDRIGAVVGTGIGGITTIEEAADRLANRGTSRVDDDCQHGGRSNFHCTGCTRSGHYGCDGLRIGDKCDW